MSEDNEMQTVDAAPPLQYPPPPPIPAALPPDFAPSFRERPTHGVLGPSFWVFGVLSWAYVVVGELVVSLGLPELLGALLVLSSTGYAWVVASGLGAGAPFAFKRLLSLFLGVVLFVVMLAFTVSLLGSHHRSQVAAVTILLWFASVFAVLLGRRWTPRASRPHSKGERTQVVAIWTVTVVATLVAMISAMGRV